MIKLSNVNFIRESRTILQNINLHIREGEHWVLLGRNGSGKTTILEMVNGYHFPSSGSVDVLGHRYGTVDLRELRRSIGYISQSLFEKLSPADPVWEVVATGAYAFLRFYQTIPDEAREKALELLGRIQLSHLQNQPLGTLSQGERKKVMLARSLMSEPKVLILDEPCSGLDLYERERMLQSVQELSGGGNMTVLYVTHHIEEIVPMFTHVALLEQGELIAAGPKREVLTPELLKRAYDVPLELEWFRDRPWAKVL
ncbi:molybdenum ABC transporter ATP-binding protein [Gordoniibacillus kamchatkensis]|uniref:Molybdenum ABC transporter ATP-binding protein n=1 Tax=Gordoniibacillus kamchatkensis TaxID=1590651 RepID=A0ABR5AHU8_9BACL|nr:ATP-binding cassette domain-containing protein [Paenibacillus sp. VKM B-2647]KIL40165.1 molybdenum ABC transporter ATP-binding protein [Paenibacillus sp. VKM B-2647]